MNKNSKIFIAGGTGMVGSAIIQRLLSSGYATIVSNYHSRQPLEPSDPRITFFRLDLTRQADVEAFFEKERPEYVFLAAAKVGGILANSTYKADFIYQNIMIASNVIHAAYEYNTKKLLNLGSSCIYPKFAPQPMKEEHLLTGSLEQTNEPYAIAKITAIKLCRYFNEQYNRDFLSVMPTNLYGPHDNFDLRNSHVLPAMIRKFHDARLATDKGDHDATVTLWGTGSPYREFLFSEDLADACVFIMERYSAEEIGEFINIGTGIDITIRALAEMIRDIVGFKGNVAWDSTKPDGTPKKLLDISRIKTLGWEPKTSLEQGIRKTYAWYLAHHLQAPLKKGL
jgi:GDP-L-fucose synthase